MDIRGKEILVTGGAGFIGSNLVIRLAKENHVYVLDDLQTGSLRNLSSVYDGIDFVKDRVANVNDYCFDPDYIFHIGLYSSSPMYKDNPHLVGELIKDMVSVLELAKRKKSTVVYASTSSIYNGVKPPHREDVIPFVTDFYTEARYATERISELYSKLYGINISAMRFFSVYGYNERSKKKFANLVSQFIWDMHDGKQPVIYGDGEQKRDFVFVDDVVDALINAAVYNTGFNVYNVGTGKNYSLNELVQKLNDHMHTDIKAKYVENPMAKTYVHETLADTKKSEEKIKFKAKISLDEGIDKLMKYYGY
ncbi:nucleotide sugar epimerase related protein [Thermoplasma acidophilum]|uniref:Nucleotide sugar epimerase related protein n=1 Tax=Thermoplasma acidophilum (strain ATCC 25905 / DSM 1728 / JCM 9062 / NBRC 15155 / AMRC-C165) TaxID=273075 RepID=Q9HL87_THEAC|nr:NAD-dependent epimerase/dehydratase family protein [Thermoplasma acidophilum]MCY0851660.1 NAD-dependent epimerase/dehydratase family protein [Thermoplasma acidophilum]CAC11487.1 nucleotide sugar epimerase related protein [Thermoplasma acidophilum]